MTIVLEFSDQLTEPDPPTRLPVCLRAQAQLCSATAVAVAALACAPGAHGQTWAVNANGVWGVGTNWTPASAPNAIDAAATLGTVITAARTITLGAPTTIGSLNLSGGFAYTVSGANALTFDVSSGNAAINVSGSAAHTILSPIVLNDTLTIDQGSIGTLRLGGGLSGTGGLIKNGGGVLLINSVAGSFTGATQINNGTLTYNVSGGIPAASLVTVGDGIGAVGSALLNVDAAIGTAQALNVTIASDGLLSQANGRIVRLSAVSGSGELRMNGLIPQLFGITGTGGDTTFSGLVTGGAANASADPNAGGRLLKSGASTLTLSGANTYASRTFVSDGSVRAASNSAFGLVSAGINNATFAYSTGSIELSNNITVAERMFLNGTGNGGAGALRNFSGNNILNGNVTIGWAGGTVTAANASIGVEAASQLTLDGVVDGGNALTKVGGGTLILNGANTWAGGTTLQAGTLRLGQAAALPTATALTVNGGTLDLNGFSRTVTNLGGTGGEIALGAGTLTVDQATTGDFAGTISGTGALIKNGVAALTLTGSNSYSGGTTVNAGTLQGNSASLQGNITNNGAVAFDQATDGTYAGAMSGTGSLTKLGAGTLTLTGSNSYSGGTTVTAGSLQGNTTSLQGNITNNAAVSFEQAADGTYAGAMSGTGSLTKLGAGTLTLTGGNSYSGGTTVGGGTLQGSTTSLLGNISNNAAVSFEQATDGTYAGAMSGTGSLTKLGAGTLTLTGSNSYSGGTTVTAGSLQGNTTSLQGNISNNAAVSFEQAADGTYAGAMSGTGSLTKLGSGALTLTGSNSYSGGTILHGGTLRLGQAAALASASALTVNGGTLDLNGFSGSVSNLSGTGGEIALGAGTLTISQATMGGFAGTISGTGALIKNGAETLTLTGTNSYSGGTTVNAGTLQGNSASLQGDIANGAAVVFNQTADGTFSGALSGTGSLTKLGVGALTLTGNNSYSGGTTVGGGTLQGNTTSLQGNISNNAAVVFDQTLDGTYAGAMSGSGALTKLGAGTLTLTGAHAYSGQTAVNGGSLFVLGSLASQVNLGAGTTIGGPGSVGGLAAGAGSIVAPGSSGGTLTVNGNFTHDAAAAMQVFVSPGGASRLNVAGTATLAGGSVDVQAQDGNYARNTRYTILNATGGVTGTLAAPTTNLAFLTPTLQYDPFNVFLVLGSNQVSFTDIAQTPQQLAVAGALGNAAGASPTGDIEAVLNALSGLTAPQARVAFDSISGLLHAQLPTISNSDITQFNSATAARLRNLGEDEVGTGLAWSGVRVSLGNAPPPKAGSLRAWVSPYGLWSDVDGDTSSGSYRYRISGLATGADTALSERWIGGVSVAYSNWRVTNNGRGDRADSTTYRVGAYGRYTDGPLIVEGSVGLGRAQYETTRQVSIGALVRTATARYSGQQLSLNLAGRYRFEQGAYGIEPFAGLQAVRERQGAFTEQGAGSLNLSVPSRTLHANRLTLGTRVDRHINTAFGKGSVEARIGYSVDGSSSPSFDATLTGDPTQTNFRIQPEARDRTSWIVGAGVSLATGKNLFWYADLNGELRGGRTQVSLLAGVRYLW